MRAGCLLPYSNQKKNHATVFFMFLITTLSFWFLFCSFLCNNNRFKVQGENLWVAKPQLKQIIGFLLSTETVTLWGSEFLGPLLNLKFTF